MGDGVRFTFFDDSSFSLLGGRALFFLFCCSSAFFLIFFSGVWQGVLCVFLVMFNGFHWKRDNDMTTYAFLFCFWYIYCVYDGI